MSPTKKSRPVFYNILMEKGFFPDSNKIIKYQESQNYWIFKTGKKIYKVKKTENTKSAVSLEEVFCKEIVGLIQQHSPGLEPELVTLIQQADSFYFTDQPNTTSELMFHAIKMNQLPERCFLDIIINKEKLTESILDPVCNYLYNFHQNTQISDSKDQGTPDSLNLRLQDLIYQSKKYLNITITQTMIDLILRPLEKYLSDNRKLFLRRIKKQAIKKVHGCFIPRKININKDEVMVLAKTSDPLRNCYFDVASDLSDLTVQLRNADLNDLSDYFVTKYCKLSNDREVKQVLPVYQALKCLTLGLENSIAMQQTTKNEETIKQTATKYYEHAIDVVNQL